MYHSLLNALRRLRRDERGNIFILFGATALPLMLVMGGAVDIARYTRYRAELANAVDAAALALARQHADYNETQATTFVTNYLSAFNVGDTQFTVQSVDVDLIDNGFHVSAQGSMRTTFLPIGKFAKNGQGISSLDASIAAEVVNSTSRIELALVLDNTGSMNCGTILSWTCVVDWETPSSSSRIVALKDAAHTLLDVLMTGLDDPDTVKVALVPFEGDVNVGATYAANPPAWIDWNDAATAKWNGLNYNKRDTVSGASCTTGTNCKFVGHKWLFDKLKANDTNVKWEGCVEMRATPYDILDTTPTTATPDTLFVPRLWPDEPDDDNDNDDDYQNNYLNDRTTSNGSAAQKNFAKFTNIGWQSGKKDTSFPFESGPNFGCPRPIVPLTNSKSTVDTAIDNMIAYWSTGTFIPTGLVWGWHVLSPTIPFTEGMAPGNQHYDRTVKAIVLLTDGDNFITETNNHNESHHSGYNYVGLSDGTNHRLGTNDVNTAIANLDTKTASLCTNVKGASIRLYTITFGSVASDTQTLMENCATLDEGERLYYHAPTPDDLEAIFEEIGEDLADIHLSM